MWMMTKIGFYSIIERDGKIQIRARSRQDIDAVCEFLKLSEMPIETPKADYRYRVIISWDEWRDVFPQFAELITYGNFKEEIKQRNPMRELLYHRVWGVLLGIMREPGA